jgi:YegS/Rv2252/BmrU family lipid kinase
MDATGLAREAVSKGADTIISYGGDGTLNEIIQSVALTDRRLAVWAGGTANVVAVDLGMPADLNALADVIAAGHEKRIALGVVRTENEKVKMCRDEEVNMSGDSPLHSSGGRYFFMFAGIGLDASIARSVSPAVKRRTGELAFWLEGFRHVFTWNPETFTISVDGEKHEGVFALVGNGKGYGGGLRVTPNARLEEPWFEVYIVPRRANNFAYLSDLARCFKGLPPRPGVKMIRGRHVEANSSHKPWVEVDGEVIGRLPMAFDVVPDALSVIVP